MKKAFILFLMGVMPLLILGQKVNNKSSKGNSEQPSSGTIVADPEKSSYEGSKKTVGGLDEGLYRAILANALKYNDLPTALSATHALLVLAPSAGLKDTLAVLYFEGKMFLQAIAVSSEILKDNPEHRGMLEVLCISQQSIGLIKEALDNYEKLYKITKSLSHLYQIATLQYALKRYGECEMSIAQIVNDANSEKEKVNVIVSNQGSQDVVIKSAALNILGVIAMEQNQNDKAKKFFEESLKFDNAFILPKANLEILANRNKPKETPKK